MDIQIKENIILANYTTFRIGGLAKYFFEAKTKDDLLAAIKLAKENNWPTFVFGGGSNLLVSDSGFEGLAIKVQLTDLKMEGNKILAGAGVMLGRLVTESISHSLNGLEWAIGIPGTIGGAIFGNAGAYGQSISETVSAVEIILPETNEIKKYDRTRCEFVYRGSRFKNKNTGEIIIGVELGLAPGNKEASQKKIKEILLQRKTKIPSYPSAGSFFKNFRIQKNIDDDPLLKKFSELKNHIRGGKVAAGYLIEQCGLKRKQVGQAMIADEHSNFIINLGGATAADVLGLVKICQEAVKEKYGLELEIEKRLIGF